jgi:hypothetical protein
MWSALLANSAALAGDDWQETLNRELPLLGHRNWIVVADSAYPLQTAPGIETIYATDSQIDVVRDVLAAFAKTRHVKPVIYTDTELKLVPETNAPGISVYRDSLAKLLANQTVVDSPHERTISMLDEAGETFKILVIKTPLTLPYTSVFMYLECGYWDAAAEQQLRKAMQQ